MLPREQRRQEEDLSRKIEGPLVTGYLQRSAVSQSFSFSFTESLGVL